MAAFKNTFSWSWSRKLTFDRCLRQYWYQHYGFWGGWNREASNESRELYIQKKLLSRPQWLGIHVHEAAEWLLQSVRGGESPTPEQLVLRSLRRANQQIEDSKFSRYLKSPKKYPGFVEHYYGEETTPWEPLTDELVRQVEGLFDNAVLLRLTRVSERIREVEELRQIEIKGIPVWVSLDVLVEDGQGGFVIVDWKTGRHHSSSTVSAQLGVYGVYVRSNYLSSADSLSGPRIRAMYVNTRENTYETFVVDQEMMEAATHTIITSARAMKDKLSDESENIAEKSTFPRIQEGSEECTRCVYRRTCGRE